MKEQKEREIKKDIADYLRLRKFLVINHRNVGIKKENGSYIPLPSGEKGVSDLLCCSPGGTFWAIEVKREAGKLTADQVEFLERVRKNKGVGMVAYDLGEVMQEVEKYYD